MDEDFQELNLTCQALLIGSGQSTISSQLNNDCPVHSGPVLRWPPGAKTHSLKEGSSMSCAVI